MRLGKLTTRSLILAAVLLAAFVAASADGELRFIQNGDTFDLSELADGESRSFGDGDHRIVATRDGDAVRISRDAGSDGRALDVTCDVSTDTCQVITSANDEHVMIRVEKRRVCEGDDCETLDVDVTAFGAGLPGTFDVVGGGPGPHMRKIVVQRGECADGEECNTWVADGAGAGAQVVIERVECVDDGNGEKCETFEWTGDEAGAMPHGMHGMPGRTMVFIDDGGASTVVGGDHKALLRCPEGDAMLHVELAEADETFLCPKHSVPLERIERGAMPHGPHGMKRRMIKHGG